MTYSTACKPGDIFYGRLRLEYNEIKKIKVLSILITKDEGIWYICEYCKLDGKDNKTDKNIDYSNLKETLKEFLEAYNESDNDDDKYEWYADLIVEPTDSLIIIVIILIAVMLVILGVVIYLYVREVKEENILTESELKGGKVMLTSAALTYVASVATAVIQVLRLVLIYGRRND